MESLKYLELTTALSSAHSNLQNLQNNRILLIPLVALTSLLVMDKLKGQYRQLNVFLKDADDPLILLSYRATPFPWCGKSPAEMLMGRKIHTSHRGRHTHTHTHTDNLHRINFKKPGMHRPVAGTRLV